MNDIPKHKATLDFQCARTGEAFTAYLAEAGMPDRLRYVGARKNTIEPALDIFREKCMEIFSLPASGADTAPSSASASAFEPKPTLVSVEGDKIDWWGFACPNCGKSHAPFIWMYCDHCDARVCTGASNSEFFHCFCGNKIRFSTVKGGGGTIRVKQTPSRTLPSPAVKTAQLDKPRPAPLLPAPKALPAPRANLPVRRG